MGNAGEPEVGCFPLRVSIGERFNNYRYRFRVHVHQSAPVETEIVFCR